MSTVTGQQLLEQSYQDGVQRGIEHGRLLGIRESILVTLAQRFGTPSQAVRERLDRVVSADGLAQLVGQSVAAPSLEEFIQHLS